MNALAAAHQPTTEQLLLFVENAPFALALLDTQMRYVAVSQRWLTDLKCVHRDVIGRSHYDIFPEITERWKAIHRRCLAGAVESAEEDRFDRADGTTQRLHWEIRPWYEAHGKIGGISILFEDVTKRRQAEERLRESEQIHRISFDLSPVGMVRLGLDARFIKANEKFCEITGYSADELTHMKVADLTHPDDEHRDAPRLKAYLEGKAPYFASEKRFIRKDGSICWVSITGRMLNDELGNPLQSIGVVRDITKWKKAEESLRQSEQLHRIFFDLSPSGMVRIDLETKFFKVNDKFCQITGYTPEELSHTKVLDITHPDDKTRDAEMLKAYLKGDQPFLETEKRYIRKDGSTCWVAITARMLKDAAGRPLHSIAVVQDITARKQAEDALREANRHKDEFLATLAHELRNPLAPIQNGLQILRMSPAKEVADNVRDMMERQLQHMVRLVDDLLDISRVSQGKIALQMERITLQAALQLALETARPSIRGGRHRLEQFIAEEPLWLEADLTRLAQAICNLINNAVKYTPDGGTLALSVRRRGDEAVLAVADNGVGIPPDMLPKVFGLFTQIDRHLDRAQGGLGIGLALVKQLIELHHGTISAESGGLGKGSTFTVRLPLAAAKTELPAPKVPPISPTVPVKPLSVLIVDDNIDSAKTLGWMMEMIGHKPSLAHTGLEALALARQLRPDVILLDIGLPGMNGYEVCRELRKDPHFHGTALIAQTGWGQERDLQLAREAGFDHHLLKPIKSSVLMKLLARL